MSEVMLAGVPSQYVGEVKELDMIFKVKLYDKMFKFTVANKNSWRFAFPQRIVEEMSIRDDTHYLLFYSTESMEIVLFLIPFPDLIRYTRFVIAPPKKSEKKIKRGKGELIYTLKSNGILANTIRKVWVHRGVNPQYGVIIPKYIVEEMGIGKDTHFILLYSVEANIIVIEIKNIIFGGKNAEKEMESVKKEEEEEAEL